MREMNLEIRLEARGSGVPLWRVAKELSISEPTLTRLLREPLPPEKEARIKEIIATLKSENLQAIDRKCM